jgi:pilus assembly protein CpaF
MERALEASSGDASRLPLSLRERIEDPATTDIVLNGSGSAFFDRGKGLESMGVLWSEEALRAWVLHSLSLIGKTWDARFPFLDCVFPSGHRAHLSFPPSSRSGLLVSLRRLPRLETGGIGNASKQRQERWGACPELARLIAAAQAGDSILVSGSTGSGKTTLTNDLLAEVPEHERVIAIEDTPELSPAHPHFISLVSRPPNADGFGEITLRTLLKQTLRMRPDRIILGECRGIEVLELLQALNTGHRGTIATLHANSPRDALKRVELLCLLAAQGAIPLGAIRELVCLGLQWIIQVARTNEGRRITEITRIEGREGDTVLTRQIWRMTLERGAPQV